LSPIMTCQVLVPCGLMRRPKFLVRVSHSETWLSDVGFAEVAA